MAALTLKTSKKTKSTPAGEIPVDWAARKLGDLVSQPISGVSVLAGDNPPKPGHPGVLRLSCVTGGRFNPTDLKTPLNGQASRLSIFAEQDTILISRSNTPSLVGASAYVPEDFPTSFLPDTLWLLRPKNPNAVSMRWLSYLIRSDDYRQALQNIASGTSQSMKKIQKGALLKLNAPTPPLPEQRKIADILSTWDDALTQLDALIEAQERRKKALMQQLLTGQTRLPGFHGEWEVKRLGAIAEMGSGGTPPSSVSAYYDGNIPWVSISDMTKGGKIILSTDRNLTNEGFVNSAAQMFPIGTVLYAMYASLGECSIAGIPLCSSQAILGIRPKDKLNGEFLYYFLNSLKAIVKTLGQQGTQANLNKGMVQNPNFSPTPRRTNRHRHGSLRHRPGAGRPGAASGEDPRPQAGHDAGTPHREDALALGRFSH